MTLDSTHPLDDLAVYALDALEREERQAVDAHLAGCASCRAELGRHRDTLARMAAPEEPPAHLWDRIATRLPATGPGRAAPPASRPASAPRPPESPPEQPAPQGPPAHGRETAPGEVLPLDPQRTRHGRPGRSGRFPAGRGPWLAAVAAAAVVVGVAVVSLRGPDGGDDVADLAEAAAADEASTVVRLTDGEGAVQARVVVSAQGEGYVLLDRLPTLPEGRSYQLWKVNGTGTPVSLGVLGDGSAVAVAVAMPTDSTGFAISEEPAGGVPTPTGPIVADGELA